MAKSKQAIGRWKALMILAVCAVPIVASYLTYYVIKPQARTNYGTLLEPRGNPLPTLHATTLNGQAAELTAYHGKWVLLQVHGSDCDAACEALLYDMRQLRLTQGRERDRIERVWLVTDQQPIDTMLLRKYDGTHLLRIQPEALQPWLSAAQGDRLTDHLYMIDPLGNLMMRFPKKPDQTKMKKDLTRLLKASSIG